MILSVCSMNSFSVLVGEGGTKDSAVQGKDKRLALIKCADLGGNPSMYFVAIWLLSAYVLIAFIPTADDCCKDYFYYRGDKG